MRTIDMGKAAAMLHVETDACVRRAIWEGTIPLQITLDPVEMETRLISTDLYTLKSTPFVVIDKTIVDLIPCRY